MNHLLSHPLDSVLTETGIGEMVSNEDINTMVSYIDEHGIKVFRSEVWNLAFGNVAFAYIHPHDDMRSTKYFDIIQEAFINAYV